MRNITLPQTSSAGGTNRGEKESIPVGCVPTAAGEEGRKVEIPYPPVYPTAVYPIDWLYPTYLLPKRHVPRDSLHPERTWDLSQPFR